MKNLLIAGNTLTPKSVGIFNLPPLVTCTPSKWCRKHCYALFGRHLWPVVKQSQLWRYAMSLRSDFVDRMIKEITRRKSLEVIRIHLAGDFYSKEYVDKWAEIAEAFPEMLFRANTKRRDLMRYMRKQFPYNMIIRESVDPSRKIGTGLYPLAAVEGTPSSENYFWCQDNCEECGFYCYTNPTANLVFKRLR